jgi:hypothetical protein
VEGRKGGGWGVRIRSSCQASKHETLQSMTTGFKKIDSSYSYGSYKTIPMMHCHHTEETPKFPDSREPKVPG